MNNQSDMIEALKFKLFSVNKQKLLKEAEVARLHNDERSYNEELSLSNSQIDFLRKHLEQLKAQIFKTKHQICMIEICKTSEESKIQTHVGNLNVHRNGFVELFHRESSISELRNKEVKEKQAAEKEIERQRQMKAEELKEQEIKEAEAVENKCVAIEQECAVLKKRNNAIMLKLRRKLVETEDARRALINK